MRPRPGNRFILLTAGLMPLGLLVAFQPGWLGLFFAATGLLLIAGLVDLFISSSKLRNLRVDADPMTRLARDVEGKLVIHLRCDQAAPRAVSVGLPMPYEFLQNTDSQKIILAGNKANHWAVEWQVAARSRGIYACPPAFVETASVLGLFQVRRRYPLQGEIRVYPNMRRERRQLANLFLKRGQIGIHAQRMVGQGREYEQLREYSVGDSMLDVHWKASAKRGELVTKTYQIERTQEIYLVIDHSRLSGLRTRREDTADDEFYETILERYVTAASILSMVAEREGDLFGMVAFGRTVSRFVRANGGKQHGQVIQNALFDLKTDPGPFDLDELFTFLRLRLRRRSLLIFLTDLSDAAAAEDFSRHIGMVAGHHFVLINSIRRPGVHPVYESGEGTKSIADEIAGHLRWQSLRQLQLALRTEGVEFSILDDEKLSLELVNQYLSVKQRQVI